MVSLVSSVAVAVRAIILTDGARVLSLCKSAYTVRKAAILLVVDFPLREEVSKKNVSSQNYLHF